jgi:hypothetical protein
MTYAETVRYEACSTPTRAAAARAGFETVLRRNSFVGDAERVPTRRFRLHDAEVGQLGSTARPNLTTARVALTQ